jgi:Fe-S-cluster containining protein
MSLYADLEAEIGRFGPRCDLSGRCCRFAEYGHTLFLSRLEAEHLETKDRPAVREADRGECPYQVRNLCSAREVRPLGCRVYFCDPAFRNTMEELSEQYIRRLKQLSERHGVEWDYAPLHRQLSDGNRHGCIEPERRAGGRIGIDSNPCYS